jgi:hypothetical protein
MPRISFEPAPCPDSTSGTSVWVRVPDLMAMYDSHGVAQPSAAATMTT